MNFDTFLFFIIKIKYFSNSLTQNNGLKLKTQAPKRANLYELQWIAFKLKNVHLVHKKSMVYESHIPNQAESMRNYDFQAGY